MDNVVIINIVLSAILVIGTIIGYRKGLLRQVLELAGIVVSFILSLLLAGALAAFLSERTPLPYSPSLIISFIIIFIGGLVAFRYLAILLQKLIRMTILGWVDRLSGAVLGLITAMVIGSLLIAVAIELPISRELRRDLGRASMSNFLRPVAPRIFNFVIAHGSKRFRYEAIFKESDSV